MEKIDISQIQGIHIGHAHNLEAGTGCTAILCPEGAVSGVDVRGGSPGTRDTDALNPVNNRKHVHGILLSGGSSFGLDAAGGVMQFLEERGIGRDVGKTIIPNVCAAILFDLKCGDFKVRPGKEMGYEACINAFEQPFRSGSVGAGTGAVIGKVNGSRHSMKGGIGSAAFRVGELVAGAVMAVNCVGDVFDPKAGKIIAGVLSENGNELDSSEELLLAEYDSQRDFFSENTVIGCVITNANFSKVQATKLASIGQNGIARTVRPAHSIFDGDTVFTLCTGKLDASFDSVGILAARAVEAAIIDAVVSAESLHGHISYKDFMNLKSQL
ncbi:MAG: peptidase family [Eubacterium sp.]|jgi:L-aminopeptidase/D-esterase-like protein|nr:peptidase family [Eubacterium sp.]